MQLSEAAKVKARQERLLREESAARTSEAIAAEHTRLTLEQERLATESYVCVWYAHCTASFLAWSKCSLDTVCAVRVGYFLLQEGQARGVSGQCLAFLAIAGPGVLKFIPSPCPVV